MWEKLQQPEHPDTQKLRRTIKTTILTALQSFVGHCFSSWLSKGTALGPRHVCSRVAIVVLPAFKSSQVRGQALETRSYFEQRSLRTFLIPLLISKTAIFNHLGSSRAQALESFAKEKPSR